MSTLSEGKVFGIGWAKTGTTTLGKCLRQLGFDHVTQRMDLIPHLEAGDLQPIFDLVAQHDSYDDWPWIILYKELDEAFPGSKFVLTLRDEKAWLKSYRNMVATEGPASDRKNAIRSLLYSLPFPDVTDEQLLERYRRHNREVSAFFADRPDDLLTVNWGDGDGWEKLCSYLGRPIPEVDFPHANRGSYKPKPAPERILRKVKRALRG